MKNKKGFTLVELLAVIVILAVLVLIAVPSVIKMLDNTKKNAFAVEAENIIKAGKNAYASEMLDGTFESGCYSLEKLGQYTDKNFDGYSGSVYIDTDTNTFKVWLSKDVACSDTPSTYTLAIDPNGGVHEGKTTVETYEIERKGVKAINDPYKVGYAFDGWETIAGSVTSFTSRLLTMSNTNVEIRAKWKTLYTYTGASSLIDDGDGNWRIRLLTDGTLIFNEDPGPIDIFLVGGGGSGNSGGGGGGGYTRTVPSYVVTKNREYEIDIGAGGFGGSGGVGGNAAGNNSTLRTFGSGGSGIVIIRNHRSNN